MITSLSIQSKVVVYTACYFILFILFYLVMHFCILVHDYTLCFIVLHCCSVTYYNYISIWPYYIVSHLIWFLATPYRNVWNWFLPQAVMTLSLASFPFVSHHQMYSYEYVEYGRQSGSAWTGCLTRCGFSWYLLVKTVMGDAGSVKRWHLLYPSSILD